MALGTALLIWATHRYAAASWPPAATCLLVAFSAPVVHCWKWGQLGIGLTALSVAAFVLYDNGRRWQSAFVLSLGVSIKLSLGLLGVRYLARSDWRGAVLLGALSALFLVGVPVAALGVDTTEAFYARIAHGVELLLGHVSGDPNSQYLGSALADWVGRPFGPWARNASLGQFALAGLSLCLPMFLGASWPHYFAYLPFCEVFLLRRALGRRPLGAAGYAELAGLALVVAGSAMPVAMLFDSWGDYAGTRLLLVADLACLGVCLAEMEVESRRAARLKEG